MDNINSGEEILGKWLACIISGGALVLALIHILFPQLEIDEITIALIIIAIIPWFAPLLRRLELPGGVKIEFKDVKSATEKITGGAQIRPLTLSREVSTFQQIAEIDPNLSLVALRIEIEKRLRNLAEKHSLDTKRRSLGQLLTELQRREILPLRVASGLQELMAFGNQSAHGAEVSTEAASWALNKGPEVLGFLDEMLERTEL